MRATWRSGSAVLILAAALCGGCAGSAAGRAGPASVARGSGGVIAPAVSPGTPGDPTTGGSPSAAPAAPGQSPRARRPLTGQVVGIDPGHNGRNRDDPAFLTRQVWNGREYEDCDTTGTQEADGYTEARFTFAVASYLRADLIAAGAHVVMTRHNNNGIGPCVTTRTQIINRAHANVAIDIHADGGPVTGRGFTILEPVADGPNDRVIGASRVFGADLRAALLRDTSMPASDYYGHDGIIARDDLAGLNLTTVPKVLVECGNMINPVDARLLASPQFQRRLAAAFTAAIVRFLTGQTG